MWYRIAVKHEDGKWVQQFVFAGSALAAKGRARYKAELEGHCVLEYEVLGKKEVSYFDGEQPA